MDATIRAAVVDDAAALIAYLTRLGIERPLTLSAIAPPPTLAAERAWIADHQRPNSRLLVAAIGDTVVGVANATGGQRWSDQHVATVGLSVDLAWRGAGLGGRLLAALVAWAETAPLRRLQLEVLANNPRAIGLYERHGFRHEGARRGAACIDGVDIDVLLMARRRPRV